MQLASLGCFFSVKSLRLLLYLESRKKTTRKIQRFRQCSAFPSLCCWLLSFLFSKIIFYDRNSLAKMTVYFAADATVFWVGYCVSTVPYKESFTWQLIASWIDSWTKVLLKFLHHVINCFIIKMQKENKLTSILSSFPTLIAKSVFLHDSHSNYVTERITFHNKPTAVLTLWW